MTTFTQKKFEAKICIYQKKAVPLRQILKTDI